MIVPSSLLTPLFIHFYLFFISPFRPFILFFLLLHISLAHTLIPPPFCLTLNAGTGTSFLSQRVALQQAGIVVDALSVGSGEGEFSASGSQSAAKLIAPPKPEKKVFNIPQKRKGVLLPKTKPPLYYSRPQGVEESEMLIKGARRLEGKLQNLNSPHLQSGSLLVYLFFSPRLLA